MTWDEYENKVKATDPLAKEVLEAAETRAAIISQRCLQNFSQDSKSMYDPEFFELFGKGAGMGFDEEPKDLPSEEVISVAIKENHEAPEDLAR